MIHSNGILTVIKESVTIIDEIELFAVQLADGYSTQFLQQDKNIQCRIILKFKNKDYIPPNPLYANFCCRIIHHAFVETDVGCRLEYLPTCFSYTKKEKQHRLYPFTYNKEKKQFEIICGSKTTEWNISLHELSYYICWFSLVTCVASINNIPLIFSRIRDEKGIEDDYFNNDVSSNSDSMCFLVNVFKKFEK